MSLKKKAGHSEVDFHLPETSIFKDSFKIPFLNELFVSGCRSKELEIPSRTVHHDLVPRLHEDNRVEPIGDIEELFEICGRVLEDDSLVDEGEQVIEGIVRFANQLNEESLKLAGPIIKRSQAFVLKRGTGLFQGVSISSDLAGLLLIWTNSKPVEITIDLEHIRVHVKGLDIGEISSWFHDSLPIYFLCLRSIEIARALTEKKSTSLLSAPTHSGGWIDPRRFVQRVNSFCEIPMESDLILALIRLAPGQRQEALEHLNPKQSGEWINTVRYALGGTARIGKNAGLWLAASKARVRGENDAKIAKFFAGNNSQTKYQVKYTKEEKGASGREYIFARLDRPPKVESLSLLKQPTQLVQTNRIEKPNQSQSFRDTGIKPGAIDWVASMWPNCRDNFFAAGAVNLTLNLDWSSAAWHNQRFLAPLLLDETDLNEIALYCLFCGLASKEPGEHGLALDATIKLIRDGRIGTDNYSSLLSSHLTSGLFNLSRLAKRFQEVSEISPLHGFIVFRSLERSVAPCLQEKLRGAADLLEVLLEFGSQYSIGVADESLLQSLEGVTGSNKTSKLAKKVLALGDDFNPNEVIKTALDGRVSTIRDWLNRNTDFPDTAV